MKKMLTVLLIAAVVFAGCAKKPAEKPEISQARALLMEGTVYLKQNDAIKAIQSFAAAIKTAPDYFEGYYLLSETLIRLRQFTQAEAVLITAIKKFPDNGVAYYLLAVAHQSAGNTIPAIIAVRKSLDIFTAQGDKEGQQRAMILLAALASEAKKMGEEQDAEIAKTAVDKVGVQKDKAPVSAGATQPPAEEPEAEASSDAQQK